MGEEMENEKKEGKNTKREGEEVEEAEGKYRRGVDGEEKRESARKPGVEKEKVCGEK